MSLAVALIGSPELIVLDEPTVGLDPRVAGGALDPVPPAGRPGVTLIVSSHVMDEAVRCDRLLLMREGRIIADTTPSSLLADTGTTDAEAAFLALIERDRAAGAATTRRARREAHERQEEDAT
ncbi:hypothetical protein AB1285_20000 [Microbacterium sp. NRRL B-14842]|uniref:hypothetical protein n=1 Tax=Microbacterium sp. NRRL B-14842 TaxID=3162881 RepID=UPI003D2D6379